MTDTQNSDEVAISHFPSCFITMNFYVCPRWVYRWLGLHVFVDRGQDHMCQSAMFLHVILHRFTIKMTAKLIGPVVNQI